MGWDGLTAHCQLKGLCCCGCRLLQGEDQKKLDVIANEVFKNSLRRSGQCCILVRGAGGQALGLQLTGATWTSCVVVQQCRNMHCCCGRKPAHNPTLRASGLSPAADH